MMFMSTTTIQVENKTKEILNHLKGNFNSKTYDEVILTLVKKKTKSMHGKFAGKKRLSAAEIMKGLRDKHNRF
ncbi:MAG: hypothetical protein ABH850_03690 [Candidatus Micrarchaeota archaeon]